MTTVRECLETAMGVALTSRSGRDMILAAPDSYAAQFGLDPAETIVLARMAEDLASLMPGFVHKRERGLRRSFAVTLALLGDHVDALVEGYTDAFAPVESTAADFLRFADYLVEEIRELADRLPYAGLVADVARFERLRIRVFNAEGPLWPGPDQPPLDPRRVDPARLLWLHPSTAVAAFGWDVRTVRSAQILPRLRPDPTNLLCFQHGEEGEVVVLRIDDETARAVELIGSRPGQLSAETMGVITGSGRPPEVLLGKLIAQGVITGAQS
jgi:hypothetical protein